MNAVRTGFEIREGSRMLAERRAEKERCEQVAEAMLRRLRVARLARKALRLLDADRRAA